MSWSEQIKEVTIDDVAGSKPGPHTEQTEPHVEQFEAARDAAVVLIGSGVVGDPAKFKFNVGLSGHGNVDHVPDPAWANDCVTISISQVGPRESE